MTDNTEQATTMAFAALEDAQLSSATATHGSMPAAPPRIARHTESVTLEEGGMSTIEQRLATFIGYNTDAYLNYYRDVYNAGWKALLRHWHWAPCLFPVPWLYMRRRFAAGTVLLIAILAAGFLIPGGQGTAIGVAGAAALCGFAGRPFYIAAALRSIQIVEARRLWPVQRDEKLRRRGALSVITGFVGTLLWVAALVAPYFSDLYL